MGSLLVHAFHSCHSNFLPHSPFPCFLCFSCLFSFFSLFLLYFLCSLVRCCCLLCMVMAFYIACRNKIYHFYHSTTFGLLWVSFPDCPLVCWLPSHHYYTTLAVPCLIPRQMQFLFCFLLPLHSYLDKGWVSLLPTLIAYT